LDDGVQLVRNSPSMHAATSLPSQVTEERARGELNVSDMQTVARLMWQDAAVQTVVVDADFLDDQGTSIREYVDADGTRVELHVLARSECLAADALGAGPLTRAQVEAYEGI
jgi:hypothetical protein